MELTVFESAAGFGHQPPEGHPEAPSRLHAVRRGLDQLPGVNRVEAPAASRAQIARVHTRAHIDAMFAASAAGDTVALDADTFLGPGSMQAALHACGGVVAGVDAVMDGHAEAVFVACRPPGHHAEPDRAMGFGWFNQIAIGAAHALSEHGLERVAIIDIDVHHGNGTQAFAEIERRLFFASIHQDWLYPGTGAAHETGRYGNIVNVPVGANTAGEAWRAAIETRILPQLEAAAPQLILASIGFDGHADDPLAGLALTAQDFGWAGAQLAKAAQQHANARLVCTLEGGYDTRALEDSVVHFLRAIQSA